MKDESRSTSRSSRGRRAVASKPPAPESLLLTTTTPAPKRTLSTHKKGSISILPPADEKLPTLATTNAVAQVLIRNNTRIRPLSAVDPPTRSSKPPTKVSVAQPHGGLLQTTNGVQTVLPLRNDDVHSGRSTPQTNCEGSLLAVPPTTNGGQEKRTLRSQDGGSRLKSDLTIYFPNYDDIIADAPKQPGRSPRSCSNLRLHALTTPEFLEPDTPIYIVDEAFKSPKPCNASSTPIPRLSISPTRSRKKSNASITNGVALNTSQKQSHRTSTSFAVLDYSSSARHNPTLPTLDPLADTHFFTAHRRAERKEKQLRNIEKERAMHEKVQLERLLEGLQGPDWLKVMGITGVTDGERKDWEPKRDYFVAEVKALVDKFRIWKEEEKRLKMEREAALLAREEEEEEVETPEGEDPEDDVPNYMDVDAWAALQLQTEANATASKHPPSSSQTYPRNRRARSKPQHHPPPPPLAPVPLEPPKPFTSFYAKPHLRELALSKARHGRNVTAFGHPLPEPREEEFALPEEYLTPHALRAHARKRRRVRRDRESGAGSTSAA
jgi:hypothetical protein